MALAKLKVPKQNICEGLSQLLSGAWQNWGTLFLCSYFLTDLYQTFMPTTPRKPLGNVTSDLHNQRSFSASLYLTYQAAT